MSKLVKKLRYSEFAFEPPIGAIDLMDEAADEIERLRAQSDQWKKAYDKAAAQLLASAGSVGELHAEIARLRLALRMFIGAAYPVAHEINKRGYNWSEAYLDEALTEARAALKGDSHE
jgi:FAD/FMN-containing dehydrogenase